MSDERTANAMNYDDVRNGGDALATNERIFRARRDGRAVRHSVANRQSSRMGAQVRSLLPPRKTRPVPGLYERVVLTKLSGLFWPLSKGPASGGVL